ncbi:hypothetical protein ABZ341_29525 [Streptomyces sp. NPDC006173]|uniref:hypothetical protein n=1 Tax=Streptomyces sp. NPDC006173 TaxID=3155349 RepID=UPI0033C1772B
MGKTTTGRTMWSTVVAAGAAVVFTGVAGVPAGAAEGGVSFTRVTVNGGKPIVIGTTNEVVAPASFRMTTKLKYDYGPTVFPYRRHPDSSDTLQGAVISSDCKVVDKATGICDFKEWLHIDPRYADFGNEYAGVWKTAARVFLAVDAFDTDDENLPLQVQRATCATVNAAALAGGTPTAETPAEATARSGGENAGMAIAMKNSGIRWTNADGTPEAAGISYDRASADDRKKRLIAEKCKDVEIVEVKPGERLQPKT